MEFSTSITVGGQPVTLVGPAIRGTRAWQKANSVFCPLGPAHSEAWMLLTKKALDNIQGYLTSDVTIEWVMEVPPPNQVETTTLSMAGWRLLQAERLFIGGEGDTAAVFLCQFVDARYRAKNENTGPIRANIRSYANSADYLTGTSGETWATLLEDLWTACSVLGAYPGLPAGLPIDGVPETQFLISLNAWRCLCTVLDQLDCAVKHNPLTNTYSIVQLGEAQVTTGYATRIKFNGEPIQSNADCADTVRVHFFYHRKGYGQERDTELATNWAVSGASDVIELATAIEGASGTVTLWDDQPWILNENESHTNNSDNVTRADNRKSRYVTRYTVEASHKIYTGLTAGGPLSLFLPGGELRAILWRNWGDGDNKLGGTVTEIVGGSDLVTGFGAVDGGGAEFSWMDKNNVTTEREAFSPPDYGRHSYPNYPRLPNIVQLNHATATAGDTVEPNADGFHKGRVRRWVANAMATLDDCWIRFVDTHDTLAGDVNGTQGEFYLGRLSGVSTSGGTLRPVYLVKKGDGEEKPTRFKLSANLQIGSNATAVIRTFNGATYADGAAIKVFDWWGLTDHTPGFTRGMWHGITGMEGWCVKREQNLSGATVNEYDIVWMEQFGRFVQFTTTENMGETTPGEAAALVDNIFGQGDPLTGAQAAINFDSAETSIASVQDSLTWIWNHTCGAGVNRFLAVDVGIMSLLGATVTRVTYGDIDLTLIGARTSTDTLMRIECWGLVEPLEGEHEVEVTLSLATQALCTSVSYNGVSQTTPTAAFASAEATNGGAADATVNCTPTIDGSWVHAGVATTDPTITALRTLRAMKVKSLVGDIASEDHGPINPAAVTAMGFTDVGAGETWAIGAYAIQPDLTRAAFIVHDDQNRFKYAMVGAKGFAVRNEYKDVATPETPYYTIVACQQMVIYATALLIDDLCEEEFDIKIGSFRGRSYQTDVNQTPNPVPTLCRNFFHHKGKGGDRVWLMWKELHPDDLTDQLPQGRIPVSEWVIIDIEKHTLDVVTEVFWKDGQGSEPSCLMKKSVQIAAEICSDPTEAVIICAVECP